MANVIFDTFKKLMSALHRPITGNEHVERYEFSRFGLTCPQCVKSHSRLFVALENLLDGNPFTNCFAVARPMALLSQVTSAISFQLYPYIFSLGCHFFMEDWLGQ